MTNEYPFDGVVTHGYATGNEPESADIRTIQNRLSELGYYTDPTGRMDADTVESVKRFQSDNGIAVGQLGTVGPNTWRLLFEPVAVPGAD